MKRRTAGERARSAGDIASASTSSASGPTGYSRSPRTWSGARLVASIRSDATADRRSATSGAASSTCSKLSSTSNVGRSPHAMRTRFGKSIAVTSASPSASAIAGATNAGFRMAANGTNTTRVGPSAAMARASSSARRVFPTPPGPVSVIEARGGIREPVPQRLHVGVAAEKGGQGQGQRGAAEFIDSRVFHGRPRASNERVTDRTGQVKRRRQRAHGLDMGPASFPALQRADRMNRQARNRRELFLCVARSFPKRLQLRAKGRGSAAFRGRAHWLRQPRARSMSFSNISMELLRPAAYA